MKKALLATTALVLSAGVAAADVKFSGYGRTAIEYSEARDDAGQNASIIETRLRLNIDASTSTDQGVDFGARVRLQYDDGDSSTGTSPAYLYVTASGLTVTVGNVNTAFDSAGLIYESEVGLISRSHGNVRGDFYAFESKSYGSDNNRMGVAVEYSFGDLALQASYVDPDQVGGPLVDVNEEFSIAADYKWNDLALSGAYVTNAAGVDDADILFLGAYYTLPGTENGIGLSYIDDDSLDSLGAEYGRSIVLYGDYVVAPLTTLSAYVSNNNNDNNETDNAFGLGAKYDLGGAYLAGSLERGYDKNLRGDFGVRFDF